MQKVYLWYDELSNRTSLDFNAEPDKFYYSLLLEKDGKYGESLNSISLVYARSHAAFAV